MRFIRDLDVIARWWRHVVSRLVSSDKVKVVTCRQGQGHRVVDENLSREEPPAFSQWILIIDARWPHSIIVIIMIATTMFMVLSSWPKSLREFVHPVHLMNVDWAPGGRQPSDQASRLGLWVRRKLAAVIHIHHRHCYYYSARRLIVILPSHEGWKAEST